MIYAVKHRLPLKGFNTLLGSFMQPANHAAAVQCIQSRRPKSLDNIPIKHQAGANNVSSVSVTVAWLLEPDELV